MTERDKIVLEIMAEIRRQCAVDDNGDPVGAQPEPGWETGYCAGIRTVYRKHLKDTLTWGVAEQYGDNDAGT